MPLSTAFVSRLPINGGKGLPRPREAGARGRRGPDADLMNVVVDRFGRDVDAVPSDDGGTATVTVPVVTPCLSGFSRHMEDGVAGKGHRLAAGYAHDELGVVIVGKEAACIIARCI